MIKRTIEISQQPAYLAVKNRQLLIHARNGDDDDALLGQAPCEDVGVLLVDHPAVTYSHAALVALIEHDAAVVLCGSNHLPAGILLPIGEHSQVVWRIQSQLAVKKPVLKQLWRQIIQAKIRAQAANLLPNTTTRSKLLALARNVRSGDPSNVEAQAAKAYWTVWRDSLVSPDCPPLFATSLSSFKRDPDGPAPNNLLNYGYAVVRAAVARALVSAGLLPAIGIRHCNRSNAFCLADDLVEPLRPLVDACVRETVRGGETELTPPAKRSLLELLAADVRCGDQTGPLMVALHRYAASLVKCYEGQSRELDIPLASGAAGSADP